VWLCCSQVVILWAYRVFRDEGEDFRRELPAYLLGSGIFPLSLFLFLTYLVYPQRSPVSYLAVCGAVFAILVLPVRSYWKVLLKDYAFIFRMTGREWKLSWADKLLMASVACILLITAAIAMLPIAEHDALIQAKQSELVFERSSVAITYASEADPETSFLTLGYGNGTTMVSVLAFTLSRPMGTDVGLRSISLIATIFLIILWGRFLAAATGCPNATLLFAMGLLICPQVIYLVVTHQKEPLLFLMYGTGGAVILRLAHRGAWKRYWPFITVWWGLCAHFYFPGSVIFFAGIALWLVWIDESRNRAIKALALAMGIGTAAAVFVNSILPLAFGHPYVLFLQPMRNYSAWVQRYAGLLHYFGKYPKYDNYLLAAGDSKLNILKVAYYGPISFTFIPLAIWALATRRGRGTPGLGALAMAFLAGTFVISDPFWLEFLIEKKIMQFFWHTKYWTQVYVVGVALFTYILCADFEKVGRARLIPVLFSLAPIAFWPFDKTERFDKTGFEMLGQLRQCVLTPREEFGRLKRDIEASGIGRRFDSDDAAYWELVRMGESDGTYETCNILCALVDNAAKSGGRTLVLSEAAPTHWYYFKSPAMRMGDPRLDPVYDMDDPEQAARFLRDQLGVTHIVWATYFECAGNLSLHYSVLLKVAKDKKLCRTIATSMHHVLLELLPDQNNAEQPAGQ